MHIKHINGCIQISEHILTYGRICNWATIFVFLSFLLLNPQTAHCQENKDYDLVEVPLYVKRIGRLNISIIIKDQNAYLPIKAIFDFLKIKNAPSNDFYSITGFFLDPLATYQIDRKQNQITYKGKVVDIKSTDLILFESELYLQPQYFGEIFGLECVFNFRGLFVTLNTILELPAIREMKQEQMRRNISKFRGEKKADSTISKKFSLFHVGMADWAVYTQQNKGSNNARVSLALGAFIAGGETDIYLNYLTNQSFNIKNQSYFWRYVNNDNAALRQITIGKISPQTTLPIRSNITGIKFSNIRTTTINRPFGTYRLMDKTEPEWMVELYLNNILINYTKADALGFYTFEIPLVYGNTSMTLRFYGPFGEERMIEQVITIPYNFLPAHEFEYTLTAGVVSDDEKSKFLRLNTNYGLNTHVTFGGGIEYLSSIPFRKSIPFVNASIRLGSNFIFSGEYANGARSKAVISYRNHSLFQAEFSVIRHIINQTVSRTYSEERKITLSSPFRGKNFGVFSSLSLTHLRTPQSPDVANIDFLLSGSIKGIHTSLRTSGAYSQPVTSVNTTLSLNFRLPFTIRAKPQVQYLYNQKSFGLVAFELERKMSKYSILNLAFSKNMYTKTTAATLGFRYNFSLVQTSALITYNNSGITTTQSARGSIMYDDQTNAFLFSAQNNVGKGALTLVPFMDLNCNGRRDPKEPKNLTLKFNNRTISDKPDSVIRLTGIEANTNYFADLNNINLDNVSYKIFKPTINIPINPNRFMPIEVPIAVVGEASGTVYIKDDSTLQKGLGRVIVCFYKNDTTLVGRSVTEPDGFFNFLGFPPGSYTAKVDSSQLNKLQMTSTPSVLSFKILPNENGDVVDTLQFVLQPLQKYVPDSNKDSIVRDNKPPAKKTDSTSSKVIPVKEVKKLIKAIEEIKNKINMAAKRIFFETAKATLLKQSFAPLNEIVQILKENESVKLDIEGHTDNVGTIPYNDVLSQKRANAVMNYLIKSGITKERLTAKGYGELRPIASNKTAEGRAQNRRAVMNVVQ